MQQNIPCTSFCSSASLYLFSLIKSVFSISQELLFTTFNSSHHVSSYPENSTAFFSHLFFFSFPLNEFFVFGTYGNICFLPSFQEGNREVGYVGGRRKVQKCFFVFRQGGHCDIMRFACCSLSLLNKHFLQIPHIDPFPLQSICIFSSYSDGSLWISSTQPYPDFQ